MEKFTILVAGGSGTRMQGAIPKQFMELQGRPLMMHTMDRFREAAAGIHLVVVLPQAHLSFWKELCDIHSFKNPHKVVTGGETRFHSVRNGLQLIDGEGLVAVHDAVRPLITPSLINRLYADALHFGNAVPVIPVTETLRMIDGTTSKTVDRSHFRLVQTPQVFYIKELKQAFDAPYMDLFTDEASVMEHAGHVIHLCEGEPLNIKITTPKDLAFAQALL